MPTITRDDLKNLYVPPRESHKGQNGKLLVIGGSHLFHAASLWSLTVASRIVDLVHYSSVPENNELVAKIKEEFRNGIIISRTDIEGYIQEDDCILIGPGMTRDEETRDLTNRLLKTFPDKQWVIDAGALQMLDLSLIPNRAILTPHHKEFADLCNKTSGSTSSVFSTPVTDEDKVKTFAAHFHCIVLLKGVVDLISDGKESYKVEGGNAGMTKGGTGDVLAGLIAALVCKNDALLATQAGSIINKAAGDELYKTVGPYFNATDLANQIPLTIASLFTRKNQSV